MVIGQATLEDKLEAQKKIEAALSAQIPDAALCLYIEKYMVLTNRTQLGMRLIELLLMKQHKCSTPPIWPKEVKETYSGVILIFAVSQLSGCECEWSGMVPNEAMAPPGLRTLAAKLWRLNPHCKPFSVSEARNKFVEWLCQELDTIEHILLVAAKLEDAHLLSKFSGLWKQHCLARSGTPSFIAVARQFPVLRATIEPAISLCIGLHSEYPDRLLTLTQAAFHLARYDLVIAASGILLHAKTDKVISNEVQSLRLAALGALDRDRELITEYRRTWQTMGMPFPFPELILYNFQRNGEFELERHILLGLAPQVLQSSWVSLCHRAVKSGNDPTLLAAWQELYANECEEYVLFGLSRCLAALIPMPDKKLLEDTSILWSKLIAHDRDYHILAGYFLVALAPPPEGPIKQFEFHLHSANLSHPLVARAGQKYLRALSDLGLWQKVGAFLSKANAGHLARVCSVDELAFHLGLSRQASLPSELHDSRTWIQGWEKLLSIKLRGRMIVRLIKHFRDLEIALNKTPIGDAITSNPFYEDMTLQLQRRGNSEVERILSRSIFSKVEDADIRHSLKLVRNIEGIYRILSDLATKFDYDEEN